MKKKNIKNLIKSDIEDKRNLFFIILTIVLITACLIALYTIINNNLEKERSETADYTTWLSDHCICMEENLIYCPSGYDLVGKLCLNKTISTPTLTGCSKYNCAGQIKFFDVGSQKWLSQN
jgi:hypothetical protein